MRTKLLQKLRNKADKEWSVKTDAFGQAWIYFEKTAMRKVICHQRAERLVKDLRTDFMKIEIMRIRYRKRREKQRIY